IAVFLKLLSGFSGNSEYAGGRATEPRVIPLTSGRGGKLNASSVPGRSRKWSSSSAHTWLSPIEAPSLQWPIGTRMFHKNYIESVKDFSADRYSRGEVNSPLLIDRVGDLTVEYAPFD